MSFEQIISAIQEKPEIWLSSHASFKNRVVKAKVWRELAARLKIEDFFECMLRYNEDHTRAPAFLMEPPMKVEFSNSSGSWIDCTADGHPAPKIEWINMDGHIIHDIPHIRTVLPNGTLVFPPFSESNYQQHLHNTVYRCAATNTIGTIISRDVVVRGVVNQHYTIEGNILSTARGCTAVLQCTIPPYVKEYVKVVSWLQETSTHIYPSLQGDGKFHVLPTGELLIHNVDYRDKYQAYRCRTINRLTKEAVMSDRINLRLLENRGTSSPAIVSHTSVVQVPQDEGAVLICIAQACPQPDYRWYQIQHGSEAVFVLPGPRTRVLGPVLAIEAASSDDSGRYKCTASNNGGEASAEINLSVTAPLSIELTPHVQTINIGGTAEFKCTIPYVHHPGVLLIFWYKNGQHIGGKDVGRSLIITGINREDRGMYQCFVRRAEGDTAQASAELRLGDAGPSLSHTFIEQTLQPGPSVSLKCMATANPTPIIKWMLDGYPLPENERFHVGQIVTASGEVISHANISHVTAEDGGEYTCMAENRVGKVYHSARLNVYGLPYIRPIPKITAVAGEILQLKCPVSGYPIENISWEKDRRELPIDLRQKILNGVLYVEPVQKDSDSGTYTCTARNKQGQSARRSGEIFVIVPPKLNPIVPNRILNVGERASLTCSVVKGDLPLTISWIKDDHPVKGKTQITVTQVDQYNSLLVIDSVMPRHSGNYSCIAQNPVAKEVITQHLMVNVPPSIEPFYFTTDGLQEGTRTRVICGVSRGDSPLEISWLKDGSPISSKLGVNISMLDPYSSLLSISSLSSSHSGDYTCVATNPAAQVRYSSKLQVKVPPKWIVEPTNANIERSKHAIIDCQAEGVPEPILLWKKAIGDKSGDYSEIRDTSTTKLLSNGSLMLQNVNENMEGFYLCQASNGIGNAIGKVIELKVRSSPFFSAPSRTISVKKGETATLQCNVNGDKPITVKWIRNGKLELSSKSNYRVNIRQDSTSDGVLAEMQISSVESTDSGAYFCQASNLYGKEQQLVSLHVQEPPESPKDLQAVMVNSQAINIQWQQHSSHESEINRFIVQYKRKDDEWQFSEVSSTLRGTLIESLRPATRYTFRVISEGPAGQSKPSSEIVVTTDPQKPSGAPIDIQIQPVSSTELVVTWSPPHEDLRNGDIQGYNIGYRIEHYDSTSYNMTKVINSGETDEELVLQNLLKYTRYAVVVQAFNQVGEGPLSDPVVAQTMEDVPSMAPLNILCTPLGSQSLQIAWKPPPLSHSNGVIQGYKIQYDSLDSGIDDYGIRQVTGHNDVITNLHRYTNYSVEVLAYTRMGDGVYSKSIHCITEEDAPGPPEDIKAIVNAPQSLLISWLPPNEPNGIILKYYLYTRIVNGREELNHGKKNLPSQHTTFELKNLQLHVEYQFWITAVTKIGEGQSSKVVSHSSTSKVIPAKISSFGTTILKPLHLSVTLQCNAVGNPAPRWQWMRGEYPISQRNGQQINNGNLELTSLQRSDTNNYTCMVQNKFGSDAITYQIIVQVPPSAPVLYISGSTSSSILLHWKVPDNGNSPIVNYVMNYRKLTGVENQIELSRRVTSYELKGLTCGSTYQVSLVTQNKLGLSKASNTLTVRTQGQKPSVPQRSSFIAPGSTSVLLNLYTWPDNGCPILYFVVKYRQQNDIDWIVVSNSMKPQRKAAIPGLLPATEYHVQVEGHNTAGFSAGDFYFFTLTKDGEMPPPETVRKGELSRPFYTNTGLIVPLAAGILFLILFVIILTLYWRNKTSGRSRKESLDNDQNLVAQRERFYATLQKSTQDGTADKIPETASDISPYATFHIGESNNTLLHSIILQERSMMDNLATPQTTICKTRRVRRRSNRRAEVTATEESDSDMEQRICNRTESSNQLESSFKGKQGYIYQRTHSSTSSELSPKTDHKTPQRSHRPRLPIPGKSTRSPLIAETSFHGDNTLNESESNIDSMKKVKLGVRSSLWTRPVGSNPQQPDYSIAV